MEEAPKTPAAATSISTTEAAPSDVTGTHAAGLVRNRAHRSAVCGDLDNDGDLDFARNEHGRSRSA
jgi:hypothetical protein